MEVYCYYGIYFKIIIILFVIEHIHRPVVQARTATAYKVTAVMLLAAQTLANHGANTVTTMILAMRKIITSTTSTLATMPLR